MKKILTLLFISLLAFCVPANIFADEDTTEVSGENASVVLYAAMRYLLTTPSSFRQELMSPMYQHSSMSMPKEASLPTRNWMSSQLRVNTL